MIGKFYKAADYESYIHVTSVSEHNVIGLGYYTNSNQLSMIGDHALPKNYPMVEITCQTFVDNIIPLIEKQGEVLRQISIDLLLEKMPTHLEPIVQPIQLDQTSDIYASQVQHP